MYIQVYISLYVWAYIYVCHMYVCMYVWVWMCAYTYACMYVCVVCPRAGVYEHAHGYICTHTYAKHIYMYNDNIVGWWLFTFRLEA